MLAMYFVPRSRHVLLVLLLTAVCCSARSQPAHASAAVGPAASTPTIRTTSRIVYVDVVVHDDSDRIVHGLQEDNFRVTEDKEPQRISLFEAHTDADVAQARPKDDPSEMSNLPASARDTSLNIILLDLLNTSPQDQSYARKRMVEFLKRVPAGRQVALFVLGNRLHMVQGFSTDSSSLVKAAEAIDIRQLNRLRPVNQQITDLDTSAYLDRSATTVAGPSQGQVLQQVLMDEDVQNMKVRLDATANAFQEMARAVNGYPGRKNLFWLAGQFPSANYYSLGAVSATVASTRSTPGGLRQDLAGNDLRRAQALGTAGQGVALLEERADKAVADSQIAVYPISLAGVQTDNVGAEQNGGGTGAGTDEAASAASTFFFERQTGRAVMTNIADITGGEAFYGSNDPAALLKKGFEDGENYYEIAFQPTNHNWDGKFRTIHIAVNGSGYHLSYRKGYYALPEQPVANAMATFASAMRIETPPSTQLVIRAKPSTPAADGVMKLAVKLDPLGVGFTTDDTGDRRARLQVVMIAYPVGGNGSAAESNNLLSLGLTQEDYRSVLASGVPFEQTLPLKPGRYAIRIGILDLGSGRIGTLTMPYSTPGL